MTPASLTASLTAALADRYAVGREIGRGGMATVYLAHDVKHDRPVAIKVLHQHLAAELGTERFLSEIRTTARLRHPNILPLFDSGVVQVDGATYLYYVMPFIEGSTLRDRLSAVGKLPIDEAIHIAREVSDALEYAHAHGVIHRDIKPENILLDGGHALVADFGIALAGAAPDAARITQLGMALGTPAYMSPEQSAGDRDLDARSDLYSVACVLYEMLTGQAPFPGPTAEAILVRRFTQEAPRAAALRPEVPRHIDVALQTAMARDPAERQSSMARFAGAVTQPAPATSPARGEKSVAVLPFANMSADPDNEYFSDGIAEEIINALAQLPKLHVAARTSAFSFKGKNQDLRAIGEALGVETVLEGSVRKAGNRVRVTAQLINAADGYHLWSERYDRELTDIFAIQDEIALAIAGKLKVTLDADQAQLVRAPTANVEAYEQYLKARRLLRTRGRAMFDAVECFERAVALDPSYAAAHAGLANTLVLIAFWGMTPPDQIAERARTAARYALEIDPSLVESLAASALVAECVDVDIATATATWARLPPLDPANIDAHVMRAGFDRCYTRAEYAAAIDELHAAIAADPLSAYPAAQLAVVFAHAGRFSEAVDAGVRAVALDATSTYAHWALIHAHGIGADLVGARTAFDAAVGGLGRHPWFLMGLAIAVRSSEDRSVAEAILAELEARARLDFIQPSILGAAAIAANRLDDAIRYLTTAAEIRDPMFISVAPHWPVFDAVRRRTEWPELLRLTGHAGGPAA
ncbi:MAG: protein kinase domain-containing protein [Gemmatimonadales bacterium]